MERFLRLKPQFGDLLAAALVIGLAAALSLFLFFKNRDVESVHAEIYQDGALVRELSLETEQTFLLSGAYINTVAVQDGKIAIIQSTCPGSDCVHSGWADEAGQAIVCLPNKTEIRLTGAKAEDGVDAVAG